MGFAANMYNYTCITKNIVEYKYLHIFCNHGDTKLTEQTTLFRQTPSVRKMRKFEHHLHVHMKYN